MNLFRKQQTQEVGLMCKICKIEFSDSERTMRHMVKAHSKPKNNPFIFEFDIIGV